MLKTTLIRFSTKLLCLSLSLILPQGCSTSAYVTSRPSGAVVSINGKRVGITPTSVELSLLNRISAGSENIVVSMADHMPSIHVVSIFDLPDNKVHFDLSPSRRDTPKRRSQASDFATDYTKHPIYGRTAAVLSFDTRSSISNDEVALLADRFTTELNRTGVFILTSKSKMKEIVELQNASIDCSSSECAIELGRLLSVQYMIYGSIGKIGSIYTVNASIVSVESSRVVSSTSMDFKSGAEEVLTQGMFQVVQSLLAASVNDAD